jgi:DNA-binding CsgD family transcriptional regulator
MITCINTNISTHFVKHLFKYINCLFKEPKSLEIKKEKDKIKRKELYKNLNQEIRDLKSDLINNKIENSKEDYHSWIRENKGFLFPNKVNKSVAYDVNCNPEKYIKFSFYINEKIEELGKRPYQVIPQRNNIVPKSITLNSNGIVDLIDDKKQTIFQYNKSELVLHAKKHQKHIWNKILKLEKKDIFKQKEYVFYNQIITDGFSCSLLFILKKYKNKVFGDKLPKVNDESQQIIKELISELNFSVNNKSWDEFEIRFNKVHPSFYTNLEKEHPKLSLNERKLCALLLMSMSSKDISNITGQSVHSINIARGRLRNKLKLVHSGEELSFYLSKYAQQLQS